MLRRILALLAAFVVALGLGLVVATPAQAVSDVDCPIGRLCLFEGQDFDGSWIYTTVPTSNCYNVPASFASGVSSAINRTSFTVRLYTHTCAYLGDPYATMNAGTRTWFGYWSPSYFMNDKVYSVRRV